MPTGLMCGRERRAARSAGPAASVLGVPAGAGQGREEGGAWDEALAGGGGKAGAARGDGCAVAPLSVPLVCEERGLALGSRAALGSCDRTDLAQHGPMYVRQAGSEQQAHWVLREKAREQRLHLRLVLWFMILISPAPQTQRWARRSMLGRREGRDGNGVSVADPAV